MPSRLNHSIIPAAKTCTLLLAATVAASLCAQAGIDDTATSSKDVNKNVIEKPPSVPKFYVEIGAAGEFDYHATKFISDGNANFGGNGDVFPIPGPVVLARPASVLGFPGTLAAPLPAQIQSRDFTSTHDVGAIDGRVNFGYIVNPLITVYAGFVYTHDDGDSSRRLGTVDDVDGVYSGVVGGKYDLYADVGQYQSYSGIAGVKFTLPRTILELIHAPKFISPYFGVSAGGKYLDSQHVRFYSPEVGVNQSIKLYDPSLVFTTQGGFGYELKIARNFSINVDTNYGYDTKPNHPDNNVGYSGIDRGGNRLFETVGLSAAFKF